MVVRFATVCDHYGCIKRSEEYTAFPTCRDCGDQVCPEHEVSGQRNDETNKTLCVACEPTCDACDFLLHCHGKYSQICPVMVRGMLSQFREAVNA